MRRVRPTAVLAALGGGALLAACGGTAAPPAPPGSSPHRGHDLVVHYGCGACHRIGGVAAADGRVGPPLTGFAKRRYIVGRLPATPGNVARWILDPDRIRPNTIMPDLGLTRRQARDVTAYLYGQ